MCSHNGGTFGGGVQNLLNNLASFVRNFPSECHRHVIVITFILRNKHYTNIQIELQELEGGVKATGLFCLLGIGVGLGWLFIYKLYTRLFPKILLLPSTSDKNKPPISDELDCQKLPSIASTTCVADKTLAETPDSGICADTAATDAAYVSSGNFETHTTDARQRLDPEEEDRCRYTVTEWLARADLGSDIDFAGDIYGNQKDIYKSLRSWRSSGYVSVDQVTGEADFALGLKKKRLNEHGQACFTLDEDVSDEVLSITDHVLVPSVLSEDPEDDLLDQQFLGNEHQGCTAGKSSSLPCHRRRLSVGSGFSLDVPHLWLRRNRHSFSSDVSANSGCTYRESLVSKGFSVDLGEDLTGIMTPPDGEMGSLDHWTVSSMDQLHKELRKIQEDIDYMNGKMEVLLSKEDAAKLSANLPRDEECKKMITDRESRQESRQRSRSLSPVRSRSCSADRGFDDEIESPDFIWDYHSDLALANYDKPMFVVKRPQHLFNDFMPNDTVDSEKGLKHDEEPEKGTRRRQGSDGLEEVFSDDEIKKSRTGNEHLSLLDGHVHHSSEHTHECAQNSMKHDFDHCMCTHMNPPVCDLSACLPGFCLRNSLCGHLRHSCVASNLCSMCQEKVIVHPHHSCSSCHDPRRKRPLSARTSRNSDGLSMLGQCDVLHSLLCQKSCACVQYHPAVHQCSNSPCIHFQSKTPVEKRECRRKSSTSELSHSSVVSMPQHKDKVVISKEKIVGDKMNIQEYLTQERGRNVRYNELKKSYDLLNRLWGISSLRRINTDNFCSLRAVLYQALKFNLPTLSSGGNFQHHVQKLAIAIDSGHSYLNNWKFGNEHGFSTEEVIMRMTECLRTLFGQVEALAGMSSIVYREQYLVALLNHSPELDQNLLEGLKIMMMLKAIDLFNEYVHQKNVPTFVLQLFAKDSSKSLESFFNNHINVIGNTAPIKAVDLCLLGVTLGVRIEVIQPSRFSEEGFIVHYPDEGADGFAKVHLIKEEDWNHCLIPEIKYVC